MEITSNLSERALHDYTMVKRAIAGDEMAYTELFQRYKEPVFFMVLKMVNNRTDAEDLMFEAFEKAFSSLDNYSPQFAFSTWLFKIASNNTIDFIRKRKTVMISIDREDHSSHEEPRGNNVFSIQADTLSPEEETIRRQRADFMREKVAMLSGRYRRLIELRYFEEFSYEEIAQELQLPLGTVKAQLFRARELLLNILESSEIPGREEYL
jgi:RNA polymerase sigma-70 factor (ECF subfamily)